MTAAAAPRLDAPAATDAPRPRRWPRALLVVGVLAIGSGLPIWGLVHELDGALGRTAFWWALLFAALPVLPLAALFWWVDRLRPEPLWLLGAALLYGAFVATYAALRLNGWLAEQIGDRAGITPRSAVFVAPWTEEAAKALVIFLIVIWRRHDFNAVVAGVLYGGLAGIGFAFTENILYYGQIFQVTVNAGANGSEALDALQSLFLIRGVAAPFVHPMFTVATGIGVGLAVRHRHVGVRILAPAAGYSVAVVLHMGYNTLASFASGAGLQAMYVAILIPTVVALVAVVLLARRHERQVMTARLGDYAAFGWLRPEHVPYIVSPQGRRQARRHVRTFGKAERARLRTFQRAGLDLAVLRDRLVRGVAGVGALPRERDLIATLRGLRGRVVLPGGSGSTHAETSTAASSW